MGGTASTFPRDPKYPLEQGLVQIPSQQVVGCLGFSHDYLTQSRTKTPRCRFSFLPRPSLEDAPTPSVITLPGNTVDGRLKG